MSLLALYRVGRAHHEQTSAAVAPYFILETLESIVTVLDDITSLHNQLQADAATIAKGVADIKAQVSALIAAQAANPEDSAAVAAALAQLETDVASVHEVAQGFAAPTDSTPATDAPASDAPAADAPASDAPAPAEDAPAPADESAAPTGNLSADVATGDAPAADATPSA
jgi:hypothetical protein